jgi:hypothetical protein
MFYSLERLGWRAGGRRGRLREEPLGPSEFETYGCE